MIDDRRAERLEALLGHGEAERYLGFATINNDGSGNDTFSETLSALVAAGEVVTATVTVDLGGGNYGDTSEFSQNFVAILGNSVVTANADAYNTPEDTAIVIDPKANDDDPDGEPITIVEFTQPTNGVVVDNQN